MYELVGLPLPMPEPIVEGPVVIKWERSGVDSRKIVSIFEIDFGKTDITPEEAATVEKCLVAVLRSQLKVKLERHK